MKTDYFSFFENKSNVLKTPPPRPLPFPMSNAYEKSSIDKRVHNITQKLVKRQKQYYGRIMIF